MDQEVRWIDHLDIRGKQIPLRQPIQSRDYQERVVERAADYYGGEDLKTVLIESPTGSGKTIMGLALLKYLADELGWVPGWMTMRRTNLAQARAANEAFFGIDNLHYISMFDKNPPKVDILVSDEAQHDAAASATTVHGESGATRILGLSATPFRTDRLTLAFQKVIKDAGIHRLIEDGWLSRFHHYTIDTYTVDSVVRTYLDERDRWGKSAVYWHRIDDCHRFARALRRAGVHVEVVDGSTKGVDDILAAFGDGEFPVLTSVAKLTEGFDCPSLQTVFVRDSSKLPTIQMCGRVLRTCEGKRHANVVQSKESKWQFPKTAKPAKAFIRRGGQWRVLGSSKIVRTIAAANSRLLAAAPVGEMPAYLMKRMGRGDAYGFGFEANARQDAAIVQGMRRDR